MKPTVLILGSTGRMGRHAAIAFAAGGWDVRTFDRSKDNLWDAAWGATVIVNAWNPPYTDWIEQIPDLTKQVIDVAKASDATVIIPGNIYVYGKNSPEKLQPDTPHAATNPLSQVRVDMEAAYRTSGVRTVVVRAGDYIDTEPSGNWFDMIMVKKVHKGVFVVPGRLDCPRAYNFIPDVAKTMVALANKRDELSRFEDVNAPGYTLSGKEFAEAVGLALGRQVKAKKLWWLPIQILQPVWPMARGIVEMKYIWSTPHHLSPDRQLVLCPEITATPLQEALTLALDHQIDPDKMMGSSNPVPAE